MLLHAADPDRDFSGKWVLDPAASDTRSLEAVETSLTISQGDAGILCSTGSVQWSYALDGSETRKLIGDESRSSVARWEGAALVINTLIQAPQNYTVLERWTLSSDRATLTITRQVIRAGAETEGTLVFHRDVAAPAPDPPAVGVNVTPPPPHPSSPDVDTPPGGLAKRSEPAMPPDVTVPTGTHVLLSLVAEVNTHHAKDGDHVYLSTAAPVAAGGQVIIPRGSDVAGTVTRVKRAGKITGKSELYIRFDSLVLPNGVTRDFHARPSGGEGKIESSAEPLDPGTVLMGAAMGARIGAEVKGLSGAAVGGAAGTLAAIMLSRDQEVVLRAGTHMEMVLDRDLVFHPDEIPPVH
jgi:type IV secretion system protein VirB10